MTDDLFDPLGGHAPETRPTDAAPPRQWFGPAVGALAALSAAAIYFAPRDPYGGEPHAVARIEPAKPAEPAPAPPPVVAEAAPPALPGQEQIASVSEIEQLSGVKVTRSGGEGSGAHIIRIEPPSGVKLAPAPDRRVVEKGAYGLLPKISADGARPMDVYARPFVTSPALRADAPRIALVIGGVGLNAQAAGAAIDQLPEGVTLAFAPYGADIDRLAQQARARGHETLLQAPMEPFDYPQNNPGPHTLRVDAADGGADDLQWLMSRFTGYAGVMNYLGGRFTADEHALSGAFAEIAARGLYFLDDGQAPQSVAPSLAPKFSLPNARVDVVIDARGAPQSIDAALAQLETIARDKGVAIGFANAQPGTIARMARFARDLERRGIALAPVSAALGPRIASSGVAADASRAKRK